ncbi:Hypothetical predicted protein [Olea europaea subsp. europaea]|uniref:Uncharacterized protein n=1 Tax=Olea europaea subsp. europaea TaxID=158383 RepID=A0A8S0T191_OLEEU|nr:Hypothetical predicted protein [Olea europaea subsp. europaea]
MRILVGQNIDDKKSYIAAAFGKTDKKLLDIRNLAKDFTIYGAEDLKLEAAFEKALGVENGIWRCNWVCQDEETMRYLIVVGQMQYQLGKMDKAT